MSPRRLESFAGCRIPADVMVLARWPIRQIVPLSASRDVATVRDGIVVEPRDRRLDLATFIVAPPVGQNKVGAD